MTLQECVALLTPVALAFRADLDEPTFKAYHRVLKDVPAVLATAALEDLIQSGIRFLPSAPEILNASEKARRQQLALHAYDGCVECEHQKGYRTVLTEGGQKTVEPCPCKARHQQKLARLGLIAPLASLPGEGGAGDETQYPTLEQLPARIQAKLQAVAAQKVLR